MQPLQKQYDISDEIWTLLEPHLPGQAGQWGGVAEDNRKFINAVFWILSTGAPWRDLPAYYGNWNTVQRRFCRWRDKGIWARLLEIIIHIPDFEWLIIDRSYFKAHLYTNELDSQYKTDAKEGSTVRYMWPWIRMVCPSKHLSQKMPDRIVKMLRA